MQKQDTRDMAEIKVTSYKSQVTSKRINPLRELYRLGQSPWYDNIERRLFKSGEFGLLINDYGILGMTSNPTIFDKAINGSSDYDEQIRMLARANKNAYQIYDELAIQDVGTAADMLLDVYKYSSGLNGYVSIEVLPEYAHDAHKTIEYAKKLFARLNRANIMIKVPGTKEGARAVKELTAEGININATLLFSVSHYEAVAMAYIEGLKKRQRRKEDLKGIASVASVFISRIDTKVDKILEDADLRGRAAVANTKIIYQRFKEIFFGGDFKKISEQGANIQRPLWASTSSKNPNYRDIKYVEELIGPYTINTMPHQTVLAFYDHGAAMHTIENGIAESKKVLAELTARGINMDSVCDDLQKEGIKAFADSSL